MRICPFFPALVLRMSQNHGTILTNLSELFPLFLLLLRQRQYSNLSSLVFPSHANKVWEFGVRLQLGCFFPELARVTNSAQLFTPGETKALAESKVHQISRAWVTNDGWSSSLISKIWRTVKSGKGKDSKKYILGSPNICVYKIPLNKIHYKLEVTIARKVLRDAQTGKFPTYIN